MDFESQVVAKIDEIICNLEKKKEELLTSIAAAAQTKISALEQQKAVCEDKLLSTEGLLLYSNEAVKESDHATFLLISNSLCSR